MDVAHNKLIETRYLVQEVVRHVLPQETIEVLHRIRIAERQILYQEVLVEQIETQFQAEMTETQLQEVLQRNKEVPDRSQSLVKEKQCLDQKEAQQLLEESLRTIQKRLVAVRQEAQKNK